MSQETFLTDEILARHKKELDEANSLSSLFNGRTLACLARQADELAAHAYDLEKRLHAAWNEQRWEKP